MKDGVQKKVAPMKLMILSKRGPTKQRRDMNMFVDVLAPLRSDVVKLRAMRASRQITRMTFRAIEKAWRICWDRVVVL